MQTVDDRGQRIRLERLPQSLYRLHSPHVKLSEIQLRRDANLRRTNVIRFVVVCFLVFGGLGFLRNIAPVQIYVLATPMILLAFLLFLKRLASRQSRIDCLHHLPVFGWCPACGHNITGTQVHEDMCRVCPECGGAWRVPV